MPTEVAGDAESNRKRDLVSTLSPGWAKGVIGIPERRPNRYILLNSSCIGVAARIRLADGSQTALRRFCVLTHMNAASQ